MPLLGVLASDEVEIDPLPRDDKGCGWSEWRCKAGKAASDALTDFGNSVLEAIGKGLGSLGTIWVKMPPPKLSRGTGDGTVQAGDVGEDWHLLVTVLGYVTWVALAMAVLSLIALAAMFAVRSRSGEGMAGLGKVGWILGASVVIAAAGPLVRGLIRTPSGGNTAVGFVQNSVWWYMLAAAVLSVIIGGGRMAWEQRAEPGKKLVESLLRLIIVAGASLTIINMLLQAADGFANWIIDKSLDCDVEKNSVCFGQGIADMLAFSALGVVIAIVFGLLGLLVSAIQILLMLARSGMLVVLAGVLPLTAAATNTEAGMTWFKRAVGWTVAFILYKPAAAIVYAAAFQLVGTDVLGSPDGLVNTLTGLMLMILSIFALPALMRFVTPMVGAMAAGGGGLAGAAMVAGAMALPTGAAKVAGSAASSAANGASSSGNSGQGAGNGSGPSSSPSGANPTPGGSQNSSQSSSAGGGASGNGGAKPSSASGSSSSGGTSDTQSSSGASGGGGGAAGPGSTSGSGAPTGGTGSGSGDGGETGTTGASGSASDAGGSGKTAGTSTGVKKAAATAAAVAAVQAPQRVAEPGDDPDGHKR